MPGPVLSVFHGSQLTWHKVRGSRHQLFITALYKLSFKEHQQAKKGAALWAGVADPDYPRDTGLQLCIGIKEEYAWRTGNRSFRASLSTTMFCDHR